MLRDVKESYGKVSMKKAGSVEKSKFKHTGDPHQDVLDKLIDRPFLKHKVMESKSVKGFISDIFQDGFKQDMVIFEPGFVRKYPQFSSDFVNLYFQSNTDNKATDGDFLETYETLVQPRRWQRTYKSMKDDYSASTNELIFNNKAFQGSLFKDPTQKKAYEVFKCKAPDHKRRRNLIIQTIGHKLRQQLLMKTDDYIKGRFEEFKERKQERQEKELHLPFLTLEQKQDLIISDLKKKSTLNMRLLSEDALKKSSRNDRYLSNKQDSTFKSSNNLATASKEQSSHQRNSSIQKDLDALKFGFESRKNSLKRGSSSYNNIQLPLIRKQGNSSLSLAQEENKSDSKMNQYSQEVKTHMEMSALIYSLQQIIAKLAREKQKKDPNVSYLQEQIDLAKHFLEKLKSMSENFQQQYEQIEEVVQRIESIVGQAQETLEKIQNSSMIQSQTTSNIHHDRNKYIKALFINKLSLLEINKNQLKNTSTKYLKFYQKSKRANNLDTFNFLRSSNTFSQDKFQMSQYQGANIQQRTTQDTTQILNQMRDSTLANAHINISNLNNESSIMKIQNQDMTQSTIDLDQKASIHSNQQIVNTLEKLITIQTAESGRKPLQSQKRKKPILNRGPNNNHIKQSFVKKNSSELNNFEGLIKKKDFTLINEQLDVQKYMEECIKELQPYKYYDEVIREYFGGHMEFNSEEEESKKIREAVVEGTVQNLITLAKENSMTSLKALQSIENHVKNEKTLTFKEKQEKSTLIAFLNQLPDKVHKLDSDDEKDEQQQLARLYDYGKPGKNQSQDDNPPLQRGRTLDENMEAAMKAKFQETKKKKVGFDLLMYIQDLKIFHNEYDLPLLVDQYIKKYSATDDIFEFQKKNLIYYRKQLDQIEHKLINLIQKFN